MRMYHARVLSKPPRCCLAGNIISYCIIVRIALYIYIYIYV